MEGYNSKMNIIFGLAFLTLAVANPTSEFNNMHEYMTDEELKNVFQAERHNVPKYHVTQIYCPRLHKRSDVPGSSTSLRVNVFGRDINLVLNPTDGILVGFDTPLYLARNKNGKNSFVKSKSPMKIVHKMLEDKKKAATLMVKKNKDGRYKISGTINSEGVGIKPLPDRLNKCCNIMKRSIKQSDYLKNITLDKYSDCLCHVIYKKREIPDNAKYISLKMEENLGEINPSRSKRDMPKHPEFVYPEILLFLDYATFKLHGKNVESCLEYMLPLWNSVDLRFRLIEVPKIRLNIAGIVIATDEEVLSYISSNKVSPSKIDETNLLMSISRYMYQIKSDFPFSSYDIAITMTPHSLCTPKNGKCDPATIGLSYDACACSFNRGFDSRVMSIGIIQDRGIFDGITTAAHELGHLFGADHDECTDNNGYIMSASEDFSVHTAYWSKCSLKQIATFFKNENPSCLYDKPKTKEPMRRALPGYLLTADQQCQRRMGTNVCPLEPKDCKEVLCSGEGPILPCRGPITSGLDGTICGAGKMCFLNRCLSEAEISDLIFA